MSPQLLDFLGLLLLAVPGIVPVSTVLVVDRAVAIRRRRRSEALAALCHLTPFAVAGGYALLGWLMGGSREDMRRIFLFAGAAVGLLSSGLGLLLGALGRRLVGAVASDR
ncbi:MAG TPA: hypothetical protein VFF73_24335 [Planctomycetota bacterium]|nr:hypothetical protein [Planctomycetota bacterium]